jgi:Tol biopolymer transport system component
LRPLRGVGLRRAFLPDEPEILWQRGDELDVSPCWPVYWPDTRRCYFSGVDLDKRTLYSLELRESGRAKPVETKGQDEQLGNSSFIPYGPSSFSPDGRYLLFHTDRP